jgi:hypothetical protein
MSIIYPGFQKASSYLEKYARETFSTDAGQRSRAIIPGDDPGDQEPPERPGFYPAPRAVAAMLGWRKWSVTGGRANRHPEDDARPKRLSNGGC